MRRAALALTLLAIGGAATLMLARFAGPNLRLRDVDREMQSIVSDAVSRDASIRNCVLAVTKGDGSLAWSGAAGIASQQGQVPMSAHTPIYIASVTKLYTATVIMHLFEKGSLSLEDPMGKYVSEKLIRGINLYAGKDYSSEITIAELLSQRSGIADYYTEKAKDGKSLAELLRENPERSWSVEETIARARDELKPKFRPGTDVFYSDTNYQLLGKVIEAVSGKPLYVVYEDLLFRPLRLEHTWLIGHRSPQLGASDAPADVFYGNINITQSRANRAYWADGGIVSTAQDMTVFLKALRQGRIIRQETLKLMHQWHGLDFFMQYGFGTMHFNPPWLIRKAIGLRPLWGHSGSTGSFLYYSEDLDIYMAGTIDQTEAARGPFFMMLRVMRAIEPTDERKPNPQ